MRASSTRWVRPILSASGARKANVLPSSLLVVLPNKLVGFAFGLAVIADVRGWESFGLGSGVLTIFDYKRTPEGTETVIGTGAILAALLAGTLNAIAGTVLWTRTARRR
jgi:hypothetical protein